MLMVIFGAGASYDSAPYRPLPLDEPSRPPLADQLFADRFGSIISKYNHLAAIATRMIRGSVEPKLEDLLARASTNPEIPKQLAAVQYYLQEVIGSCQIGWNKRIATFGGVTNYWSFMNEVEDWRQRLHINEIFLVTFNYDTLLEECLTKDSRFGMKIEEMDDYIKGRYKLIKPHGSIDWCHLVSSYPIPYSGYRPADATALKKYLISVAPLGPHNLDKTITLQARYPAEAPTYPALAIPVETKSEFECPESHLAELDRFLPAVRILITVGWRATEKRFMDRIVARLSPDVKVQIVSSGQSSAEETAKSMEKTGLRAEIYASPALGFTDYAIKTEAERFLKQASARYS